MTRFLVFLLGFTALSFILLYSGLFSVPSFGWLILLYVSLSTVLVYYLLYRQATGPVFTQSYLLSIVLKMITGCIFILLIIWADRKGASSNALLFIVAYLAYTALEVGFLYHTTGGRGEKS